MGAVMKTIEQLKAEIAELNAKRQTILDKETFTDEDDNEVRSLKDSIDKLEKEIAERISAEEKRAKAKAEADESDKSIAQLLAKANRSAEGVSVEVKPRPLQDAIAAQYGEKKGLGKYLIDVARSTLAGKKVKELLSVEERAGGQSIQNPETGGYLVGTTDGGMLLGTGIETGVFSSKCTVANLDPGTNNIQYLKPKGRSMKAGYRFGGIQMSWTGEQETISETQIKWEVERYFTQDLKGIVRVTNELLSNASGLQSHISSLVPRAFGFEIDLAIFEGNGSGQMKGMMNSGSKITVAKETSQVADTINFTNIVKMIARGLNYGSPGWYAHKTCLPELIKLSFKDDGVHPVFVPYSQGAQAPIGGTLFGLPLQFVDYCNVLGDEGDLVLADWSHYRLIDPQIMRADESMHVYFTTDQMAFRFVKSIGGAPMHEVSQTPLKGTTKESEFVTLAARA